MESPIQLISTDFDGTIFAEFEDPPVPVKLQELIGRLQAHGAKWVINTGRDLSSLMEALGRAQVSVHPDYLVLIEREIHVHRHSEYVSLPDWNDACHRAHQELFALVQPHVAGLVEWIEARFQATLYADAYSPFCMVADSHDDADAIQARLEMLCQRIPKLALVRNDVYARFGHTDFNKGTALAEITRRAGLSPSAVFAVGDHLNDLPMLNPRYAHFLAAPANAVAPVRAAVLAGGGYVSPLPRGQGTADALAHHLCGRGVLP